jgi:hypothetical protein
MGCVWLFFNQGTAGFSQIYISPLNLLSTVLACPYCDLQKPYTEVGFSESRDFINRFYIKLCDAGLIEPVS